MKCEEKNRNALNRMELNGRQSVMMSAHIKLRYSHDRRPKTKADDDDSNKTHTNQSSKSNQQKKIPCTFTCWLECMYSYAA